MEKERKEKMGKSPDKKKPHKIGGMGTTFPYKLGLWLPVSHIPNSNVQSF
jgi:hypothetical protein